ncbi:MAG: addiction module protein [Candidatus Magnetoglobus multicellularis str. Araruama]|uniref:Addiction module protein n=1 Tax=Candidatus Magnetoglobus multicellularis str. Araruama TaxID=890399 RepID=A0A1V1P6P3_9BACT|nr:MAG: addiction module protein [Candidatus Magnetoglobus multicellularis str. Araruama]
MKQNIMLQGLNQMSTVHRIQMMEAIWDSLLYDQSDIKSPDWHKNILADRKRKIEEGTAEFFSVNALKENFRE